MGEYEARKEAARIMQELEFTIKNYGSAPVAAFNRIMELSCTMRDRVNEAHWMRREDKSQAFELIRHAKLLALSYADAQEYIERLELIEDDLRHIA